MAEPTEISFIETPDGAEATLPTTTTVRVNVGIEDAGEDFRAELTIRLYANGERIAETVRDDVLQDAQVDASLNATFESQGNYRLRAFVGVDWYNVSGFTKQQGEFYDETAEASQNIVITERNFTADVADASVSGAGRGARTGAQSYKDAWSDRTPVRFEDIQSDEQTGTTVPQEIDFAPNDNPNISVDVSGRFATHEIIGGVTVRQKIGESPVEISVDGACNEETAQAIDKLRNARQANFISDRISMTVHIASASTDPLEDGGAVDMDKGDILYSYSMNLVGIENIE